MAKRPDNFAGLDLTSPSNRVPGGRVLMAANVRAYGPGQVEMRTELSSPIVLDSSAIILDSSVQSLVRMNDTTPAGPADGFVFISVDASGRLYVNDRAIAEGLSSDPVSIIPSRPNASVQSWAYVFDSSMGVTIHTKFALDNTPTDFNCFGAVKVRSDGLIYKTGIKEPPLAPSVGTENTIVVDSGPLLAKTIPWTNYAGQNPNFDYGQTGGPPNPGTTCIVDGTAPFAVNVANASTVTITSITGTATINGGAKTPTSPGPAVGSTNPGGYVQTAGSSTPPGTVSVVVGAFTDGAGNVVSKGVAPYYVPAVVDLGGNIGVTIQVPSGARDLQIGINTTAGVQSGGCELPAYNNNSGSFQISWQVETDALPPKVGILNNLSLYYWGDSPQSGAVASYIWKNPGDTGGGTPRSTSNAVGTTTGNSFIFDATFSAGIPSLPGVGNSSIPMEWASLSAESAVTGETPVFASPITATYPSQIGYQDFNFCLYGQLYIPEAGQYTFVLTAKDAVMWGIEGASLISATVNNGKGPVLSSSGQTITVAQGYPLLPTAIENTGEGGGFAQITVVVSFAAAGTYGTEIDGDYWYNSGRILLLEASPTPGAPPTIIPPITANTRTNVSYAYKYRSSLTGAQSNPSPTSTPETTPVLANTIEVVYSPDPQVDKIDYYRQDVGLSNFTYVATGPNTNPPTPITDSLTDAEAANNQEMTYTDYEPVPSIDIPNAGICNVAGGVITATSGSFNTRWLPGTTILIGYPTQLPYTFITRPTSTTQVSIPGVPDGTNLVWNIAEPVLANQPIQYMFGPTDNINYVFGVGDPLRPGTLYWCNGSNLDSWADTNQFDVTDPNEALINGAMSGGRGVLFSIKRGWVLTPNFFNALANVTGTSGSTWTAEDASISRGLYIPRCLIVQGGGKIFFRVDDGIHYSNKGIGSQSITDEDLDPIFVHEGSTPVPVVRNGITIYPPDDSLPERQKFSQQGSFMYWDYIGTDGHPHTLVYDTERMGWVWDMYDPPATIHASNQGESVQGNLVGCIDGSIRFLVNGGVESPEAKVATPAIGGQGWMTAYEATFEYKADSGATVSFVAVDANNGSYGPSPIVLPGTGGEITKFTTKVSPSKWKLLQTVFDWSDPSLEIYLQGCSLAVKPWDGEFKNVPLFHGSGGEGGQV